jgi:hypothetical protein
MKKQETIGDGSPEAGNQPESIPQKGLSETDIQQQGFEKIGKNLYKKDGELWLQYYGKMTKASEVKEDDIRNISDYAQWKKETKPSNPPEKKSEKNEKKEEISLKQSPEEYMRGTEDKIVRIMDAKLHLDSIINASKDQKKLGEGILWHELKFHRKNKKNEIIEIIHQEPSVELVDMIAQDMGHITTEIKEFGQNLLEDPNSSKKYLTYYCVVEARDLLTKTTGLGASEQIIDFSEIEFNGRTFARTNAIRKAERNAKERLIPIPRKALVALVIRKLEEHEKTRKKQPTSS